VPATKGIRITSNADVRDPESDHLLSRAARCAGRVAVDASFAALWAVTIASPGLALIALIVWPWSLPLLAFTVASTIYLTRRLKWLFMSVNQSAALPEGRRRLSYGAAIPLAVGVLAWPLLIALGWHLTTLFRPPTRDLLIWLRVWQWGLAIAAGVGSVIIAAFGRAVSVQIARSPGRRWGAAVAGAAVRLCIGAGVTGLLMLCLVTGTSRGLSKLRWGVCYKDLLNLNTALRMYSADNDDTFPPSDRWCDVMEPYVKNPKVMVCPEAPSARSGYALNSALAGRRPNLVESTRHVITIIESDRSWNASGGREALPTAPRHGNGDNYGLLDGTCTWDARRAQGRDTRGVTVCSRDPTSWYLRWDMAARSPQHVEDRGSHEGRTP
jgi:hypothetical protein